MLLNQHQNASRKKQWQQEIRGYEGKARRGKEVRRFRLLFGSSGRRSSGVAEEASVEGVRTSGAPGR